MRLDRVLPPPGPCLLMVAMLSVAPAAADVPSQIGGGNIMVRRDLSRAERQLKTLRDLGCGMCRIPLSESIYFSPRDKQPHPEQCDALVLLCRRYGVEPIFLCEYYTRWAGPLGGYEKWKTVGRALAERFRPDSPWLRSKGVRGWGVRFYTAVNEPTWKANNPEPIPPDAYARALEGLADGVHGVDANLRVSPGGYIEGSLFRNRNPYAKAAAPLFNAGKLHSIDIHRYWDVKHVPWQGTRKWSLQSQFDQVRRDFGITAEIGFHTTEMNVKRREISETDAARMFLTALWDALGVVGSGGKRASEFVMPWNLFHPAAKDEHYGLCEGLDPWRPTARGKVLRLVCRLAKGMEFVICRPRTAGEFVLEGGGRRMWVWQNRKAWTGRPGTSYTAQPIPAGAQALEVYRWNSWSGPWRTVDVAGKRSVTVDGLEVGETYMFVRADIEP
ncbi:MAG: hypothetical protein R6X20_00605 [Phycisphaerae bacterium]